MLFFMNSCVYRCVSSSLKSGTASDHTALALQHVGSVQLCGVFLQHAGLHSWR